MALPYSQWSAAMPEEREFWLRSFAQCFMSWKQDTRCRQAEAYCNFHGTCVMSTECHAE